MQRVLVTGKLDPIALEILRRESDIHVDDKPDLGLDQIMESIDAYDCLVSRSETAVERPLIDKGSRLRVIARAAVGVGNIDVDYATEKGILVLNTPGLNTNSAAELTFGLLLAAVRKLVPAHVTMQKLGWDRHRFTGRELRGKTIGIVGLGNVGHRVAKFARGFDMHVLAYDPYLAQHVFERHQADRCQQLDDLLRRCDVLTVHVPKNKETTGMIGRRELALLPDGAVVLNAARGGIIDEKALLDALKTGKVSAAGIDTWDVEPPKENPFKELPNVVMSPHIGASTVEAQRAIGVSIAEQTVRALRGDVVDFPVNMPQMRVLEGSMAKRYTVLAERLGRLAAQFIDFVPSRLEATCQGSIAASGGPGPAGAGDDGTLIRLSFLKGFVQHTSEDLVTHVNAERKAQARGLEVVAAHDPDARDYESAIRFVLSAGARELSIAGVVFSGGHMRLTQLDEFMFEMEPRGRLLVTKNLDQPGMIGVIGTTLGQRGVNIDQFELARNRPGGEAMALIRVDTDASDADLDELRGKPGITLVKRVSL